MLAKNAPTTVSFPRVVILSEAKDLLEVTRSFASLRMTALGILFAFLTSFFFTTAHADQLIIEPDMGRTPILDAMNNTKNSLQLVMYGLTDATLINALIKQHEQGKNLQILLEERPYKADNQNNKAIRQLEHHGIEWHGSIPDIKLIHQKTLLLDERKAIVMTFNFTQTAFKKMRNFALVIDDPDDVKEIAEHFSADWNQKTTMHHSEHLIWSPENSRKQLIRLIVGAKNTINVYAQQVSDYKIIGALANAAKDGVQVNILTSKPLQEKQSDFLTQAGVHIRYSKHLYIHAKAMIIDDKTAVVGSTNLTRPSLDDNRELSVISEDGSVVQELNKTFIDDWDNALEDKQPLMTSKQQKRLLLKTVRFLDKFLH